MPNRSVVAWSSCLIVGVLAIPTLTQRSSIMATLTRFEVVHVVAHLLLYGTLAFLCLRSGLSRRWSVLVTLGIATIQEGIQVVQGGRAFYGAPEAFDFVVDATAVIVVLALFRRAAPDAMLGAHADPARAPLLAVDRKGALLPGRQEDRVHLPDVSAAPRRAGAADRAAQARGPGERPDPDHR